MNTTFYFVALLFGVHPLDEHHYWFAAQHFRFHPLDELPYSCCQFTFPHNKMDSPCFFIKTPKQEKLISILQRKGFCHESTLFK